MKIAIVLLPVFFLTACNTLSQKQCESTNWGEVGYDSALSGKKIADSISSEHRQCDRDYGLRPDFQAIKIGYKDGLEKFCTRGEGRHFGTQGGTYRDTCPAAKENEFLSGYQLGRIEYTGNRMRALEEEVDSLRSQVRSRDSRITELEGEVSSLRK